MYSWPARRKGDVLYAIARNSTEGSQSAFDVRVFERSHRKHPNTRTQAAHHQDHRYETRCENGIRSLKNISPELPGFFLCGISIFGLKQKTLKQREWLTQKLFDRGLISESQFDSVKTYRSLGIFSVLNELLFLLYLSLLMFTSGIGIVIYQNIDSIENMSFLDITISAY